MVTRMLVHLIADYGPGDLAFAEVAQRLALHLPGAPVVATCVPPFDTLSAGFCVAQLALTEGPAERAVYHNVAPRRDQAGPRRGNEGEPLVLAKTGSGVVVLGPNAGYALSFLRGEVAALRVVPLSEEGSQFRSRDFFPELLGRIVHGDDSCLGPELAADAVPAVPQGVVAYVDGYGNLKTSWRTAPAPSGTRVRLRIRGQTAPATVSDGTFAVPAGELSFAPGSSGWPRGTGESDRFYEVFLRGSSAAECFGHPRAGDRVEVGPDT
jgi:hypothetical protein